MDFQSGLVTQWTQWGVVTRAVALLLHIMSVSLWIGILVKALGPGKFAAQARGGSSCNLRHGSTVLSMRKA